MTINIHVLRLLGPQLVFAYMLYYHSLYNLTPPLVHGPEVIKVFLCSIHLGMKFLLLITTEIAPKLLKVWV